MIQSKIADLELSSKRIKSCVSHRGGMASYGDVQCRAGADGRSSSARGTDKIKTKSAPAPLFF